mmetsp:Transcript_12786/g.41799  ORF Transcript_12786/g.41799 Transcript_12786/m.41799 type:complete len:203 (+) Transcript_12786:300-908(+)
MRVALPHGCVRLSCVPRRDDFGLRNGEHLLAWCTAPARPAALLPFPRDGCPAVAVGALAAEAHHWRHRLLRPHFHDGSLLLRLGSNRLLDRTCAGALRGRLHLQAAEAVPAVCLSARAVAPRLGIGYLSDRAQWDESLNRPVVVAEFLPPQNSSTASAPRERVVVGGVCYWRERGKEAGHVRNTSVSAYGRVHTQVCRVVIQ